MQGPGFLRYMVRRIVGGSLQAMTMQLTHKIENGPLFLKKILEEKNPRQQLKTASAHGLVLRSIVYRVFGQLKYAHDLSIQAHDLFMKR